MCYQGGERVLSFFIFCNTCNGLYFIPGLHFGRFLYMKYPEREREREGGGESGGGGGGEGKKDGWGAKVLKFFSIFLTI